MVSKIARRARAIRRASERVAMALESLESRQMLTLLGIGTTIPMDFPRVVGLSGSETLTYSASTQHFDAVDITATLQLSPSSGLLVVGPASSTTPNRAAEIHILVNNSGQLSDGSSGADLLITGKVQVDATHTYDGVLLTGEIVMDPAGKGFGYFPGTPAPNSTGFDFRFSPTGGALASYFVGKDIGVSLISETPASHANPATKYNGDFTHSFTGLPKATIGPIDALPSSIQLVKLTNGTDNNSPTGPVVPVGSTVTWTYIVTNNGQMPLQNVVVTDDNGTPGDTSDDFTVGTIASLATGASATLTATGIAHAGQYENYATAAGTDRIGRPVSDTTLDHYFAAQPAIHLVKLTNGTDNDSPTGPVVPVGSTVTWTYIVTNTGNVPLNTVQLVDDQGVTPVFVGGDANSNGLLDTTETWTYSASGVATAGQYANLGTVTAKDALDESVSDTNPDHYFGAQPSIDLVKLTNGTDNNSPTGPLVPVGSTVTWTYQVTNTGNVELLNVVVVDDNGTPGDTSDDFTVGTIASLTPGAAATLTHTGIALAGQYENYATATGKDSIDEPVTDTDLDHYYGATPAIHLVKLTNGTDNDSPTGPVVPVGSTVTWTYIVTNTGNVPLNTVQLVDDQGVTPVFVGGDANSNGLLDTTETWTYSASGIATAGQYANLGTVTAKDDLNESVTDKNPDHYFGAQPSIDLVKLTNGTDNNAPTGPVVAVGSTVTWSYQITNTGNVELVNVVVVDDNGTPGNTADDFTVGTIASLAPGASATLTASGIAHAGQYENYATATGKDSINETVNDTDLDHYFGATPAITLVKLTNGTDNNAPTGPQLKVGSTVTWSYIVTNTGNVDLIDAKVVDDNGTPANSADDFVVGIIPLLAPGATTTLTASGTAQAGQYTTTAVVEAVDTIGEAVSATDVDNYFGALPSIALVKLTNGTDNNSPTGPLLPIGSTVTWTYNVTNTGNVTLNNVVVVDDNGTPANPADDFTVGTIATLAPGASAALTATGTAQAGQYTNNATATGKDSLDETVSATDVDNYFGAAPSIKLVKLTNGTDNNSPTGPIVPVGSTVTWSYVVTNTGNVPLVNVNIVDDNGTPANAADDFTVGTIASLAVGGTTTLTATGTAQAGQYENYATATGKDSTGQTVSDNDLDHYFGAKPSIALVKLTNGTDNNSPTGPVVAVGSTVTWTYKVTNTGNVPLLNVKVVDDNGTPGSTADDFTVGTIASLAVGGTATLTATGIAQAGQYENYATATGKDSINETVTATDVDHYFGATSALGDFVWKDTNKNGIQDSGELGIPNVTVKLLDTSSNVLSTTTTDGGGYYHFTGLTPGSYQVQFVLPSGYSFSPKDQGSSEAKDSDASTTTGITAAVTLVAGQTNNDVDAGMYCTPVASISGTKYLDLSGNGLSSDDTPLQGVTIRLYADKGTLGKADSADIFITSLTTAADGSYSFDNLAPGRYIVQEVVPTGYIRTAPNFTDYYAVNASNAQEYAGNDFANFKCCGPGDVTNISYTINNSTTVSDLRGKTHEGDTVTANFTIPAGHNNVTVSLVSYLAPSASFDANTASQQTYYEVASGTYGPGTYHLTVHLPSCFYQVDFVCGLPIDQLGPAGSNIFYTPQNRLFSADNGGIHSCCCTTGSLSGTVYVDKDKDGVLDNGETGIQGVLVTAINTDTGQTYTDTTDKYGAYSFDALPYGHYKIVESQPSGYTDGKDTPGNGGGSAYSVSNDTFCNVLIRPCDDLNNWNFGEISTTASNCVTTGQTATIGFWQNPNGQCLIRSLNGSKYATKLGDWLATNFPNLWGASSATNLAGKSNDYIANFYVTKFKLSGPKIDAQVLAVALAVYVTNSNLAGSAGLAYGFKVTSSGVGSATFNVGSSGAAFGVSNNTTLTVMQILNATNSLSAGGSTAIYNGSSYLDNLAIVVYDGINNSGDIK